MVHWPLVSGIIGIAFIVVGSILGYVVFPPMVRSQVKDSVVLEEGTDQFGRWQVTPQALDFKVYIFHVLNPDEVQMGGKPRVEERGPYIYSQYRVKNDVLVSDNRHSASFTQQQTFFFNARASAPLTENDQIVVLNMHVNSILQIIEKRVKTTIRNLRNNINRTLDQTPVINIVKRILERIPPVQSILQGIEADPGLNPLLNIINGQLVNIFGPINSIFLRTTPRELLFDGIPFCMNRLEWAPLICDQVHAQGTSTIRQMDDGSLRFSFFHHKNVTHDGEFEINTGVDDISQILQINKWKLNSTLNQWLNPNEQLSTCNMLNGTDGSALAPFRERSGSAYIFSSDICRSVEIHYEAPTTYQGIPGLRFATGDNFLNEIGPEFGTDCYCTDQILNAIAQPNGCLFRGALDLSTCTGAPVVLTHPHFMGAAPEYTSLVDGLHPDPEKHRIFLDVEPNTGSPLNGGKRVQFNMFLRPIPHITITEQLSNTLFPVIWVDEGIELNDAMVTMINNDLLSVLLILDVVTWVLISLGIAITIGSLTWYLYRKNRMSASNSIEPIYSTSSSRNDMKG